MAKKLLKGTIVSAKMDKTVVVSVEIPKRHPVYNKAIKNTRRFKARNMQDAKLGDLVWIEEAKPFSQSVTWLVKEVIKG